MPETFVGSNQQRLNNATDRLICLTLREIQVLEWIAVGKRDKEIGRILNISSRKTPESRLPPSRSCQVDAVRLFGFERVNKRCEGALDLSDFTVRRWDCVGAGKREPVPC